MIYSCKPTKIKIYVNTQKKSISKVKQETGCDAIINGGVFNGNWTAGCWLKVNGKRLASEDWKAWGFGWDENEVEMLLEDRHKNYINCVALIREGKKEELIYPADMGGARQRTAWGIMPDGTNILYCDKKAMTPEALQEYFFKIGAKHALMLDGGGSTQGIFPDGSVSSDRVVHNFICFFNGQKEEDDVFKIALSAGHGINTPGKRCMKSLDPNETREWWLNDRVCDHVESLLSAYEGYALMRMDDSDDGEENIELEDRVSRANAWPADIYLSIHHNAGAGGTNAGGIVCFSHPLASKTSVEWRDELYEALIEKTGLRGNRANPKTTGDYYVLRKTAMPAVLLELGFMDSKLDVPVILTDAFAKGCAQAIVDVIVRKAGLKKKPESKYLYKVQLGAFSQKSNAEALAKKLKGEGYDTYIVQVDK